jgi:hypothetical protein
MGAAQFTTTRDGIEYDLMPDYSDRVPDQGQHERTQIALVDWGNVEAFKRAILPDVRIGENLGQSLDLSCFGSGNPALSPRVALHRLKPQQHPNTINKVLRLYAMEADVVEGLGYPNKSAFGEFEFRSRSSTSAKANQGRAFVRVVWKTLPFTVEVPDEVTNAAANSELLRWCHIKTSYAGQNLELTGTQLHFINQVNGAIPGVPLAAGAVVRPLPERPRKPVLDTHLTITWRMVPRVPHAATLHQGRVNFEAVTTANLPENIIFRRNLLRGTLLYMVAEISDPYRTVTGTAVADITYHFLYRDNQDTPRSYGVGHNFALSPANAAWLRVAKPVPNPAAGNPGQPQQLGPTGDSPWPMGHNLHDYFTFLNLFRMDGDMLAA